MNSQTNTLRFDAIPVIDLMGGNVVRAKRGERHAYRPIASSLCDSPDPVKVAHALFELYPFRTLYIADLDAIQRRGNHLEAVAALRAAWPKVEMWIDAGIANFADCRPWLALGMRCVLGSESQSDADDTRRLIEQTGPQQVVLSLDFAERRPKGPGALFDDAQRWPDRVIAMTLARVGSYAGPDFDLLQKILNSAQGRRIYAAGGVRDSGDLQALKAMGIAGALLASALHDRKLAPEHIASLMQ